ncbi:hypothetical protein PR202_ga22108 [Eleusine coracana subsp. coracana]|uniref:AAA+ ATPase domain-containing protein n=1 Tax=Eleusine coracana subsp. coracana TaxID=191504 RepID=A0AAV5D2Q2_ELECO|nr:hypothetical protein PR202_ga22108 [Eleusine coracana subsp. coracana]
MAATSSSSAAAAARGIRIAEGAAAAEATSKPSWASLGLDGVDSGDDEVGADAALSRARGCDVYVGHGGGGGEARRLVAWLRAELELLGVPCAASDRGRLGDAPSHAAARAAMDAAAAGVVVVAPASLANPYAVEELRVFADRGALVPVLVGGLSRADLAAVGDIVEKRGEVWGPHGGHLWKAYDGEEKEWRAAVEGLARAEPMVVVGSDGDADGDVRARVLDVLDILGLRLGRRAVTAAVKRWRGAEETDPELPFPRNAGFVGREKEILDIEAMLRGPTTAYAKAALAAKQALLEDDDEMGSLSSGLIDHHHGPFVSGVVCVSGPSGAGKTELAMEFAYRHARDYKRVLWVHGEPRFLRQGYLALADHLGVAVGDAAASATTPPSRRSLPDIEGDAIGKIRKELARNIPYLLIIDNLESDKDWWDGRAVHELLPHRSSSFITKHRSTTTTTQVIITTRLALVPRVRTMRLGNLAAPETMQLMKGTRAFAVEDVPVLRSIEEKVGSVALGVALVGAILLALLDREAAELGAAVARLLEASSFFAPAPIPVAALARAACGPTTVEKSLWKRFLRTLNISSCASTSSSRATSSSHAAAGHAELEALVRLGFARRCARAGHVSVHAVFRLFSRRIGSGHVGRSVVRAILVSSTEQQQHHAWAACLALFRFEAPAAAVELPSHELARFVTRLALPLAAKSVAACSAYAAALELLREATDTVRRAEDRYGVAPPPPRDRRDDDDLDPRAYEELARARAELLGARAGMMVRAGEYGIARDHCLTAIDILEVVCGDAHPETQKVRDYLEQAVAPHC